MTIDETQPCRLCGGTFTVRALIAGASRYWSQLHVVYARRPCCPSSEDELQIHKNKVVVGYTYAAGAPHFCGMEEYDVPGLALDRRGEQMWLIWDGQEKLLVAV